MRTFGFYRFSGWVIITITPLGDLEDYFSSHVSKMIPPFNRVILHQVIHPHGNNYLKRKALCVKFIAALLQRWKLKTQCSSQIGKWIHKLQSISSVECYSAFKMMSMNTVGIWKDVYYIMWNFKKQLYLHSYIKNVICFWLMTLYRRQGSRPSPWKRNAKKQNGCLGRPYK